MLKKAIEQNKNSIMLYNNITIKYVKQAGKAY